MDQSVTRRQAAAIVAGNVAAASAALLGRAPAAGAARLPGKPRPLMHDFMGLNVHTVQFKPELYKPVCRLLRDYHGLNWDVGDDTDYAPRFPMARNGVDWKALYGGWSAAGYAVDVCVMFGATKPDRWKDMARDAAAYGEAFARYFGPSGAQRFVESMEIGNEPGNYSDAQYRTLFENMARGARKGDPKLLISTCATVPGKSEQYAKSLSCVKGLEPLYDVINLHTYAFAEQYPTWRRSYPEDPKIKYLTPISDSIAWRNANAPGKAIWVTEFGWDASMKPPPKTGDFSRWMSSTETQQAQYLVRSFLVFSAMDVDRAYIYFFNDEDEPQLHGSSGITRHFAPKPAFHAVAHLYSTLGGYRLARTVAKEEGRLYAYEYVSGARPKERIWAVWSPTGTNEEREATLPAPGGAVVRAERMPLKPGAAESVRFTVRPDKSLALTITESPAYLWIR
ncbi:MAG TPA: hypothetical protein VKT77_01175 [Chthonomonadaceae bacterium]|nr:hypothetical protein [Chthonomonadaceae bacterium]